MGSARAGSPKATSRHTKRKHSRSTSRNRSSKRARSHRSGSSRRGSKCRSMRARSRGKSSRAGKSRALIQRSSSGRSSLASRGLKGKVTKNKLLKKEAKGPKHAIGPFIYFISHERGLAKKQKTTLPPITEWTRAVAAKWRGMTPEEQRPFYEKARQDKIRYKQELARFNGKKSKSTNIGSPQSGFLVFLEDFRKGNNGESKDVVKAATVAWSKTSNTKKRAYQQRACDVRM